MSDAVKPTPTPAATQSPTWPVSNGGGKNDDQHTLHGDSAAKRRAVTELLFFASMGDLQRCKRIVQVWNLKVNDPFCADYDRRTPLHLSSGSASHAVTEWLIEEGVDVNAVDKFHRTPLEEAVRSHNPEIVQLLVKKNGRIFENNALVALENSSLAGHGTRMLIMEPDYDVWEIDPNELILQHKLGEGEFGVVHKASYHGTEVAVKVLKVSTGIALGDFRTEIATLRQVHHPNAVQFLGACTKQTPYMLVTELMTGGSLQDAFRLMNFQMPLRRGLEIALDAARGMNYLHTRKPSPIIHRDLKPGNFMVGGSVYSTKTSLVQNTGVIKIADFGLSKTLPTSLATQEYEMTGETGTYRYMAPEVFRHEPYNTKVDVYAFAMLCFELFEGRAPFDGWDPVECAKAVALQGERPIMIKLDKENDPVRMDLKKLIGTMWASDPARRPAFSDIIVTLTQLIRKVPRSSIQGEKSCCSLQ
mmetsp:Transcript_9932/g.17884  ORF Transcript_9932/g.17884 Transcript_9932/m.17884 type:complete len:474 (-) Transcript_9932:2297-3718(-)